MSDKPAVKIPEVNGNPGKILSDWRKKRDAEIKDEWTDKKMCPYIYATLGAFVPQNPLKPNELTPFYGVNFIKCQGSKCGAWDEQYKMCVRVRNEKAQADIADYHRIGDDGK